MQLIPYSPTAMTLSPNQITALEQLIDGAVAKAIAPVEKRLTQNLNQIEYRFDLVKQEFAGIHRRLDTVDSKLEAITEMLTTRQEVRNLVRELRERGIELDEKRIFVS